MRGMFCVVKDVCLVVHGSALSTWICSLKTTAFMRQKAVSAVCSGLMIYLTAFAEDLVNLSSCLVRVQILLSASQMHADMKLDCAGLDRTRLPTRIADAACKVGEVEETHQSIFCTNKHADSIFYFASCCFAKKKT
eukprot:1139184-Pelagomonas_calceolata.AAC.5